MCYLIKKAVNYVLSFFLELAAACSSSDWSESEFCCMLLSASSNEILLDCCAYRPAALALSNARTESRAHTIKLQQKVAWAIKRHLIHYVKSALAEKNVTVERVMNSGKPCMSRVLFSFFKSSIFDCIAALFLLMYCMYSVADLRIAAREACNTTQQNSFSISR